jgi:serine/threonine protein kinase/ankyrin repeat protein
MLKVKTKSFGRSGCAHMNELNSTRLHRLCVFSCAALKDYREQRENGDKIDAPKEVFPIAGLDGLDIESSNWQAGSKWPDKEGRYWWKLKCKDGREINDFYWKKDEIRGYPDKADSDRYWFSVHHAPSGTKIEGFSVRPDREKGYPDKDGNYWSYVQYDECGSIKAWMEQKDKNYVARLQREKEPQQPNAADLRVAEEKQRQAQLAERLRIAEMKELEDRKLREESEKRAVEMKRLEEARLAAENAQRLAAAEKKALEQERLLAAQEKNVQTKTPSKTLLETVSSKDLTTLKQLADSKKTVWTDVDTHGNNVFHLAAKKKSSEAFKLLLKSVSHHTQATLLHQSNEEGETPLHLAARSFKSKLVSTTLRHLGKNTDTALRTYSKRGYLPIHEAAQSGKMETIQALLNAGADIHAVTRDGLTVVQCAELNGHSILAQSLALMMKSTSAPSSSSSSFVPPFASTPPQTPTTPLLMQALYDYQAQSQQELAVVAGESITVLQQNANGWWVCRNSRGQEGYLPMNYLGAVSGNSSDKPKSSSENPEEVNPKAPKKATPGINEHGAGQVNLLIPFSEIRLGKELGRGGFGAVYRADWQGDEVAVKQLFATKLTEDVKEEFLNEASVMMQLRHGNIVQLYGISLEPYCIIMEFLSRGSLDRLLHSKEPLSFALRYSIALDIAKGLGFLHRRHVLHRDLKSLNVLLDEHYKAKLSDFGLSKIKNTSTDTYGGAGMAGTLMWIAPELLMDAEAKYTKPCDVYSYGMVLWELLSRQVPYRNISNRALIPVHVGMGKREIIPLGSPEILSQLTQRCWAQEAGQRPEISEVVRELSDNPITDETPIASPYAPRENIMPFMPQQPQGQPQSFGGGGYAPSNAFFAPQGPGLPPAPGAQSGFGASGFFQPGMANAVLPSGYMQSMPGLGRGLPPTPGAVNAGSQPAFFQPSSASGYGYGGGYPSFEGSGRGLPPAPGQPSSSSSSSSAAVSRPASGYGHSGYQ